MRLIRTTVFLLSLTFGSSLAVHAQAQRPRISYKERQKAKRLFGEGRAAYRVGNYEDAIIKWQDSYELSKEPLIFESLAAAYERLGDVKNALMYVKKWRSKSPRREHAALDERIKNLQLRLDKLEQEEKKKQEERRQTDEANTRKAEKAAELSKLENQRREEEQRRTDRRDVNRIVGFSTAGLGLAATIAGVVMGGMAAGMRPDESEACATNSVGDLLCRDQFANDIETSNTLATAGDITWIGGAVLVAAGTGWLLWKGELVGDDSKEDEKSSVSAHWAPGYGGLKLQGRF